MYRIYKYLTAFLLFPFAAASQIGYLAVDCPESTTVYLDSVLIARQPFSGLALLPGKYRISIDPLNDFSWQRRTLAEEIEIKPFERTYINLNEISTVKIYSNPIGSDVFAGNRYLGKTPLIFNRPAIESEEFSVKHAGYREERLLLENDVNVYQVALLPVNPAKGARVQPALPGGTQVNWYKESLVLTSFVSSWAAFFFKRKADDLYLQYQGAAIPSRIDYFYTETEKFDRYAEVALGVSAVSLGVYLFILMIE